MKEYIDYLYLLVQETFFEKVEELHTKQMLFECIDSLLCQLDELNLIEITLQTPDLDLLQIRELTRRVQELGCYGYSEFYFPYLVKPVILNPFPDEDKEEPPITFTDIHNNLKGIQGGKVVNGVVTEAYHLDLHCYEWVEANCNPYIPAAVTLVITNNIPFHRRGNRFIPVLQGVIAPNKDIVTGWNLYRGAVLIASATGLNATEPIIVNHTDTFIEDTTVYRLEAIRQDANPVSAVAKAEFIYPIIYGMYNGTLQQFNALSLADKKQVLLGLDKRDNPRGRVIDLPFLGMEKTVIIGHVSTYGEVFKIENPSLIDEKPAFFISPSPMTIALNFSAAATIGDINFSIMVKQFPNYFDTTYLYDLIWA